MNDKGIPKSQLIEHFHYLNNALKGLSPRLHQLIVQNGTGKTEEERTQRIKYLENYLTSPTKEDIEPWMRSNELCDGELLDGPMSKGMWVTINKDFITAHNKSIREGYIPSDPENFHNMVELVNSFCVNAMGEKYGSEPAIEYCLTNAGWKIIGAISSFLYHGWKKKF